MKTDASIIGVAGMLLQQQDGEWRLIATTSHQLKPAERNYAVFELEALAIVHSCAKFRHFLLNRSFKILTDHCALCALNKKVVKNARVERCWSSSSRWSTDVVSCIKM